MKFALVTARKKMRDRITVSFFFNARGGSLEKSTLGMYRSLLLQLLQQLPTLQDELDLSDFIVNHDTDYRWHIEPLKSLFHQTIETIHKSKVVCLIDVLDECDEDEVRDMISFFEYLGGLATSKGISFLVCFSSRHYPYISVQNGLSLILENQKEHAQDIVKYVKSELKIGQSNIANQIHADIPRRSRGIFMWAILVVLILNKEYDKGQTYNLRIKYQEIPGGLHELFRDILRRISDEKSRKTPRCLQWTLFAERPLTPEELYSAVLSDISPMWAHREILEHDIQRFVLDSSLGFADIIASNHYVRKTVQFIHESVKDFLLKENGLRGMWPDSSHDIHGQSHEELKQCCLRWIAMGSAFCSQNSSSEERTIFGQWANEKLPFLNYATDNILYHANAAQKYGISQAGFLKEFEADPWIIVRSGFQEGGTLTEPRPLYTLAAKDMGCLIECHPSKLAFSEVGDEHFRTPLLKAFFNGNSEAVLEFLKAQAETTPEFRDLYEEFCHKCLDVRNFRVMSTFTQSKNIFSYFDHPDEGNKILQVALLLSIRRPYLNLHWEDKCSQSPLLYVYGKENKALLGVLVEKCINDVNEISRFSSALLRTAVKNGHEDFVELLLQKGAKIDARNSQGETALFCAVQENHKDMVQLLIKAGADIEARINSGQTALFCAVQANHQDMIQLLIKAGADTEASNYWGHTALLWAVERNHKDIVQLLIKAGADIEASGDMTLLMRAATNGYKDLVDMLLEKGANIEATNELGMTPLIWAIRGGYEDVVIQLLEKGSNIEATDENGQTRLMRAIRKRNPSLVRLLLNRGAKVTAEKVANIKPLPFKLSKESGEKIMANSELTLLKFAQQFEETEINELLSRYSAI